MTYEMPRRLAQTLHTVGPVHEDIRNGYHYSVSLILTRENEPAGFLLTQRLAEKADPPLAPGHGISFQVPPGPDPRSDTTFVYTETLADALAFIQR